MVMPHHSATARYDFTGVRALVLIALWVFCAAAQASVTATTDRDKVDLNESFTLQVAVDGAADAEPDVSPLDKDFDVGQGSQYSNMTIINGHMSRSTTWSYSVTAKHTGELTIPPISVGAETSEPVNITVTEATQQPPGKADVFITADVDTTDTYVQAQVLYRIKVYRAVPTRQPQLSDPSLSGVEVITEPAGDDQTFDAVLDGKNYSVVERVYALFPQASGEIHIDPTRFEARVLTDGRISGRKIFTSEPVTITVKPIPPPPPDHPNAAWLPAKSLSLSEDWSSPPVTLTAGVPVTRHITISALGQLETQIPAPEPANVDGVNVYPDKPDLTRKFESGGILGERKDQYALIAVKPGNVVLPAVEVPWWNLDKGAWEVARLPKLALTVVPGAQTAPETPAPTATPAATEPSAVKTHALAPVVNSSLWWRISVGLALLWLLTLLAWWWSSRPKKRQPRPDDERMLPLHKRQARYLKAARSAALAGDSGGLRNALLEWGKLQWQKDAPRSIAALATRVSLPLASELQQLSRASYGNNDGSWDGEAIAKALRSFRIIDDRDVAETTDPLPPLMPT